MRIRAVDRPPHRSEGLAGGVVAHALSLWTVQIRPHDLAPPPARLDRQLELDEQHPAIRSPALNDHVREVQAARPAVGFKRVARPVPLVRPPRLPSRPAFDAADLPFGENTRRAELALEVDVEPNELDRVHVTPQV